MQHLETLEIRNVKLNEEKRQQHNARKIPVKRNQEDNESANEPNVNDSEHMKTYYKMLSFYKLILSVIGIEASFQWDWKRHFLFLLPLFFTVCAFIFIGYTMLLHYVNDEYVRILEPLVIVGIATSCILKYFTYFKYWKTMMALLFNFHYICRRTREGTSRATILNAELNRALNLMKVLTVLLLSAVMLFLVISIKINFIDGERMSLIPTELPFCDQSTLLGFIFANIIQAWQGFYSCTITLVYAVTFISVICGYIVGVHLLSEDFKDLDRMWSGDLKVSVHHKRMFLWNICRKRQDMNCYMEYIKTYYEKKFFFYICVNYFGQIVSLYQITMNDWTGGIGPFLGLFGEMFFYCFMGTLISISDDKLCYIITDTQWYTYDLVSQKIMALLLKEAQKEKELQVGVFGVLNLNLFVQIVKSIYSYYAIVSEVL